MPGKNQPIGANALRRILDMILEFIKPGRGIRVERRGQQVYIHVAQTGRGTGSGGGGPTIWYTATTKAGLPEGDGIAETALGRVTAGANMGMVCVRNPDNDGWVSINVLE